MNGKQKEGGVVSFFENTRKPAGLGGKIMVVMMNFGHSAMAEWGLRFYSLTTALYSEKLSLPFLSAA